MDKIALVIVYNHQYNENIEILERIYEGRFSNIYHLVPFYRGEKSNVIPVYESSIYFQGYIAQGLKSYFKKDYVHYLFVADDLILNPVINEQNYSEHFKLKPNACFIPGFIPLHDVKEWWSRGGEAYRYSINVPGVEAKKQLPDYNTAIQIFHKHGLDIKPLNFDQVWGIPVSRVSLKDFKGMLVCLMRKIQGVFTGKQYSLPYPIVGSYSDIFVVSQDAIRQFCHYCGVFAATRLFVELALPTSLVLSAREIVTEKELDLNGKALWTKKEHAELDKYEYNLKKLLNEFPDKYLYFHPIKLSKWKAE